MPAQGGEGSADANLNLFDDSEHSHQLLRPLSACFDEVPGRWRAVTEAFRHSEVGAGLIARVDTARQAGAAIYPGDVFAALKLTPLEAVKVVILGQDPYHGPGQAHGLAFSVRAGVKTPPSLRNIFKERQRDLGLPPPASGDLSAWARRGVCLLNTTLTVEEGCAASHAGWGWEALTDALIGAMARHPSPKVFMLWGAHAQRKRSLIDTETPAHLVLSCNHPSPLSALRGPEPFMGAGHFSASIRFLPGDRHIFDN
jgi:uracil-DNA glycosylase